MNPCISWTVYNCVQFIVIAEILAVRLCNRRKIICHPPTFQNTILQLNYCSHTNKLCLCELRHTHSCPRHINNACYQTWSSNNLSVKIVHVICHHRGFCARSQFVCMCPVRIPQRKEFWGNLCLSFTLCHLKICFHLHQLFFLFQINFCIFIRIIKILMSKLRAHQMRYTDYKFRWENYFLLVKSKNKGVWGYMLGSW